MPKADISCIEGLKRLYDPYTRARKVLLLASSDGDGRPNAMPFSSWSVSAVNPSGWHLSVYVIVRHHTHDLLVRAGQFTVNVPGDGMEDVIECCVHFERETRSTRPFLMTFPGTDKEPVGMTIFEGEIVTVRGDEGVVAPVLSG